MPGRPPPPRFRVEARGRRLVTIDTWSGRTIGGTAPAPPSAKPPPAPGPARWWPRRTRFDGSAVVTTLALYDAKAPRTLTLDPASTAILSRATLVMAVLAMIAVPAVVAWPWLAFALLPAMRPKLWRGARRRITAWLDMIAAAGH